MHKGLELELDGTIAHLDDLSRSAVENQRTLAEMELQLEQQEALRQAIRQVDNQRKAGHQQVYIRWKAQCAELEREMREKLVFFILFMAQIKHSI